MTAQTGSALLTPRLLGRCDEGDYVVPLRRAHHRLYDGGEINPRPHLEPGSVASGRQRNGGPTAQRREVVVIGGGQAGLALGYCLCEQGRDFTILEAAAEPAAAWRQRWRLAQAVHLGALQRPTGATVSGRA